MAISRSSITYLDGDGGTVPTGTASTNRLITFLFFWEGNDDTVATVTIGAKTCTFRLAAQHTGLTRCELWDIDEVTLDGISGNQTVAVTGLTDPADWAIAVMVFIDAPSPTLYDSGSGVADDVTAVSVTGIDSLADYLIIMGDMTSWDGVDPSTVTSPLGDLAETLSPGNPYSGDAATAYGIETTTNTSKTYTLTWSDTALRHAAIVAVYAVITRTLAAARVYDDSAVALAAQNVTAEAEVTTPFRTVAGVQMVGDPPAESMEWRYRVVGDPDDAIESVDT